MKACVHMVVDSVDPATGGPARSVPYLADAIKRTTGIDVRLYCNDTKNNNLLSTNNIPVNNINLLVQAVKESKETGNVRSIIHNHGIWLPTNHTASVASKKNCVPLVISPRGMLEPWSRNYKRFRKNIAWYCYQHRDLKRATLIHVTSALEASNTENYNLQRPIAIVPNGTVIPRYSKAQKKEEHEIKTALCLGRIHPKKGLINLVNAWSTVSPDNWRVDIVGPDESNHKKEVVEEINRLGLSKIFKISDQVDDETKWNLYKNSDLFILPSFSENFGIVVAEALASGVPVITTKGTPWEELVQYDCGWWVEADVHALSLAIHKAVSVSCETRYRMGQNGRNLVRKKYSWDKVADKMVSVYSWILKGGTPPDCIELS